MASDHTELTDERITELWHSVNGLAGPLHPLQIAFARAVIAADRELRESELRDIEVEIPMAGPVPVLDVNPARLVEIIASLRKRLAERAASPDRAALVEEAKLLADRMADAYGRRAVSFKLRSMYPRMRNKHDVEENRAWLAAQQSFHAAIQALASIPCPAEPQAPAGWKFDAVSATTIRVTEPDTTAVEVDQHDGDLSYRVLANLAWALFATEAPSATTAAPVQADWYLRAKVADLVHLLSYADIRTPTESDAGQAKTVLASLREYLRASPSTARDAGRLDALSDPKVLKLLDFDKVSGRWHFDMPAGPCAINTTPREAIDKAIEIVAALDAARAGAKGDGA